MDIKLLSVRESTGIVYRNPKTVYQDMQSEAMADRECLWVIHLNCKNEVIEKELVSMGTLTSTVVIAREVFRKAILNTADGIIVVHNHPSGHTEPSVEDIKVADELRHAGMILGVELRDFVIISHKGYESLKESGRI